MSEERINGYLTGNYDTLVISGSAPLALDIDLTTAATSGNVSAVDLDYTNTASGINNMRLLTADLTMGASCAGPYAMYARVDTGAYQVGGLGAAFGLEIVLPSVAITTGEYHGMTLDVACTANSAIGAGKHSFIKMETWGDATAQTAWDTGANLFFLNGMTSGAGLLVSANEQTLRINIEGTSRYLFMSHVEDTISIGLTGSKKTLATTVPEIAIWSTSALTSGTQDIVKIDYTHATGGTSGYVKGIRCTMTSAVTSPGSFNAIKGIIVYTAPGYAHGDAAPLASELTMPDGPATRGNYAVIEGQVALGSSASWHSAGRLAFIKLNLTGTKTKFDTYGYLFDIQGFTEGNDLFCDNGGSDLTADGGIRCRIGGADRWLLYADTPENT